MLPYIEGLRALALQIALMNGDATALKLLSDRSFNCIAVTAYAEARGEGEDGMALVVQSIINRHKIQDRSTCKIARQSYDGFRIWQGRVPPVSSTWMTAQVIALNVIMGTHDMGRCEHVTHFLNPKAVRRMPGWASKKNQICSVGKHVAYRVSNL